jgi:hypothetical protein
VDRCRQLTVRINQLERQLQGLVAPLAPSLLALDGCGVLTAAKLVGETAGIGRFRSRAAFAMHNGTAPVPVWSANRERHRLNRGGNRQLNTALHRIAVTQRRLGGPGRAYAHRIAVGDTKTEAIRALRRRISDEVYRRQEADERQPCTQQLANNQQLDIGASHGGADRAQLAELAGVSEAVIGRMVDLGVLVAREEAAPFLTIDLRKVRLLEARRS